MWALLFVAIRRYASLLLQAVTSPFERGRSFAGGLLLIAGFPLLVLWQLLHWLGMLLDEVFFRGYRTVEIREPVFVIGPPRTGTTFLHQVLARDPAYSTFRTWECLFGLSVSARKLCLALGRLDRLLGRPAGRLGARIGRLIAGPLDDIHPLRLGDPEEDFLCFMPIAACFLLIVAFPRARWLWTMARLDTDLSERDRRRVIDWYRRAIRRHLYVFGDGRTFLSKNASFGGMPEALLEAFPDARIVVTWRDPMAAVPSQLSSLRPGLRAVGFREVGTPFRDALTELMRYYYLHLADVEDDHPDRVATIRNDDLKQQLDAAVRRAYRQLGLPVSKALGEVLESFDGLSRTSRSRHSYSLDEFGLSAELIRSEFAEVYARAERPPNDVRP